LTLVDFGPGQDRIIIGGIARLRDFVSTATTAAGVLPCERGHHDRAAGPCAPMFWGLERVAFNQVHLIERNTQHDQRLACPGSCSI